MARRPPFPMLRACFYLFGIVLLLQCLWVSIAVLTCVVLIYQKAYPLGACADLGARASAIFTEALAGILALLLAARPPTPPPDG